MNNYDMEAVGPGLIYQQLANPTAPNQNPMGQKPSWLENMFGPQNQNAVMGLASALLAQSGYSPTPQTFGQAVGNAYPAYAAGRQMDQERSFLDSSGFKGVPSGIATAILEQQLKNSTVGGTDDIKEYEYAKRSGYPGTFEQWMADKTKRVANVTPYYNVIQTPSGFYKFNARDGSFAPLMDGSGKPLLPIPADIGLAGEKAKAEAKGTEVGKSEAGIEKQAVTADQNIDLINQAKALIPKATHSGIGTIADAFAAVGGKTLAGGQEAAELKIIGAKLTQGVPRMEGPQSDADRKMYEKAAGDLGNSSLPVDIRLAAAERLLKLNKKYKAFNSGKDGNGADASDPLGIRKKK